MNEFLQKQWNLLAETATWIGTLIGGFWRTPPASAGGSQVGPFGHFFLTLAVGLMFIPAQRYRQPQHLRGWLIAALALSALIPTAYFGHAWLFSRWTCEYDGCRVVIGSDDDLTDAAKAFIEERKRQQQPVECKDLLWGAAGDVDKVWHRQAVERRRWLLEILYVLLLPVFAGGVICVIQAIYCNTARRRARRGG